MEKIGFIRYNSTSIYSIDILAWEPSIVQGSYSYSRHLPELGLEL